LYRTIRSNATKRLAKVIASLTAVGGFGLVRLAKVAQSVEQKLEESNS